MKFFNRIKMRVISLYGRAMAFYRYCSDGVWSDMRSTPFVKLVKTLNLSVRAFFNGDIQTKACALTYRTMLAVVPALALILAIGRGFGLQDVLENELIDSFESQRDVLVKAFDFVDSYLSQSSEGIFVGVGIAMLLWTLISILGSVEHAFNDIWGVKNGRSIWRKLTDYLAIFLILPVLMICASGITVFMSTTIQDHLPMDFVSPVVSTLLDCSSLVLVWFFFAGSYMLIPNTKVKFKNAFIAGILAGTAFIILQWLFVNGQIYVTKYNAIYGSFSFLPLLLIWLQLVWLITLSGAVYCYSSQNIFEFSFSNEIEKISDDYRWRIILCVMTIAVDRFVKEEKPLTTHQISEQYGLPASLVTAAVNRLVAARLLLNVVDKPGDEVCSFVPSVNAADLTLGEVIRRVADTGSKGFIPGFDTRFADINATIDSIQKTALEEADKILVSSLTIKDNRNENPNRN